jgi:hypothetical protein
VNRRAIAPLIRIRQEVWKRIERWSGVRQWRGPEDTAAVLDRAVLTSLDGSPRDLPTSLLSIRHNTRSRFPAAHLAGRDPHALADGAAVIADALRLSRGDWDVLGAPVRVTADRITWRAHPVSGAQTPAIHFSLVNYGAEEIGGDVKFLWELNRHAELVRLAQGYWLTRRPELADTAVALIDSWIEQNPPGIGINWVSAVDVAFRTIAWCWVWSLTAASDAWTDGRVGRLLWMVAHAGRFVARYDSVHHSPNTHLTGEALGLVYIGTVFPELRGAARWRNLGIRILQEEVPHQFLDDGMHYERSTGYHRYNLEFYVHALAIASAHGERWADPFREPLARGATASVSLRRPDETWPVLGDEDGGAALRLGIRDVTDQSELLDVAAALLEQPALRAGIRGDASGLAWWLLDDAAWRRASPHGESTIPIGAAASLRTAGYYIARDEWSREPWYCVVDAGPHGGDVTGHAHTDLGHVEIAHGAHWIVVDPGCPVYTSDPARRNWYRSQQAHASVTIDDIPLAVPSTPFGWRSVAPTPAVESGDRGSHWWCRLWYAYPTPDAAVTCERHVVLIRGRGVVVCDVLRGVGQRAVTVRWPLGASRADTRVSEGGSDITTGDCRICWSAASTAALAVSIDASRRSPRFGFEVDTSTIVLSSTRVELPVVIATTFGSATSPNPMFQGVSNGMDVTLPDDGDAGGVAIAFRAGVAPEVLE